MIIVNLVFIILFLLAAYLQLNDPDPVLWFGLYLSGAVICCLALLRKINKVFLWLGLFVFLTYALYIFLSPDGVLSWYSDHDAENIAQSMKAEKPWIEATREFLGLLILSSAAGLNLIFYRKTTSLSKKTE